MPAIARWLERLAAIGHGTRAELAAADALAIARDALPVPGTGLAAHDPIGIAAGARVRVSSADYAEAEVVGELVGTTVASVTIRREDARVGEVHVHFPKIGYSVEPL